MSRMKSYLKKSKGCSMNRSLQTFIISILVIAVAVTLLCLGKVEAAVGVGLISTIMGYWIRDAQDRIEK